MKEIMSVAVAILGSVTIGGAIVLGLSNWLGKVWANRLLEHDRLIATKEMEATVRKRDIYSKVAVNMRVFLAPHNMTKVDLRAGFLQSYDEAFLWASDEVLEEIGCFIDVLVTDTKVPNSVPDQKKREGYAKCLLAMRKDAGYSKTSASYRIASF